MEQRFMVIFSGELIQGFTTAEVKGNVGQLFKLEPNILEKLFSGRPCVIKKDLNKNQSQQLRSTLARLGAEARVSVEKIAPQPVAEVLEEAVKIGEAAATELALAPMEGNLLKEHEQRKAVSVNVPLGHLSLEDAEGYILREHEKASRVEVKVAVPDWKLSALSPLREGG